MSILTPSPDIVLRGHRESINCIKFLQTNLLSSGDGEGCLKIWDLNKRRVLYEYQNSSKSILTLSFIKSLNLLISCSRDGFLRILDINSISNESSMREIYCGVEHFCGAATDVSQLDQFTILSPSSEENRGLIWDLRIPNNTFVGDFQLPTEYGMLTSLHYNTTICNHYQNSNGESLAQILAGCEDGSLVLYDMRFLSRPYDRIKLHKEPILTISSSPFDQPKSNQMIVTGSSGREIQHLSSLSSFLSNQTTNQNRLVSFDELYKQTTTVLNNPGTGCSAVHQSGKIFVTGHWDGTVRLFTKKMKPLAILSHHQGGVYAVDYSSPNFLTTNNSNDSNSNSNHDSINSNNDNNNNNNNNNNNSNNNNSSNNSEVKESNTNGSIFATGSKDCTIAIWSLYSNQI